jgi:hypothetical protein
VDAAREIENLLYTYAERLDAGDLEGVADLFAHGGICMAPDAPPEQRIQGREAVLALYRGSTRLHDDGLPHTKHVTSNAIILMDEYSVETALLGAAAGMLVGAAVGLRVPLPSRASMNLDPLNRWQEPRVALDIQPRSGPVCVEIEYLIDAADVPAFLDAMAERHRIRRRDGALHWTLMRDMEQPRAWVESFEIPTWMDYVRLHMRTTQADAPVSDRLRGLHQGDGAPRVRRRLIRSTARNRPAEPAERVPQDIES